MPALGQAPRLFPGHGDPLARVLLARGEVELVRLGVAALHIRGDGRKGGGDEEPALEAVLLEDGEHDVDVVPKPSKRTGIRPGRTWGQVPSKAESKFWKVMGSNSRA
jgi:hypothetical protein